MTVRKALMFAFAMLPVLSGAALGADSTRVFSAVARELKSSAHFTVLLPKYLPDDVMSRRVYAVIRTKSSSGYVVDLAYAPDCRGATVCSIGEITGSRKPIPLTGTAVTLSNGARGYFVLGPCGASCSDSTLTWRHATAYYEVAMHAGDRRTMTRVANSMSRY
jgi:hypothetical protein